MPQQSVDLESIFQAVAKNLDQNQRSLDQLDTVNHDHGTNMAQTFRTISTAVAKKKGSSASSALAYAGKQLAKTATSSSGKMYAEMMEYTAPKLKSMEMSFDPDAPLVVMTPEQRRERIRELMRQTGSVITLPASEMRALPADG